MGWGAAVRGGMSSHTAGEERLQGGRGEGKLKAWETETGLGRGHGANTDICYTLTSAPWAFKTQTVDKIA